MSDKSEKKTHVEHRDLGETVVYKPLEVRITDSSYESFQRGSRIFRAMVNKEQILSYYKKANTYEKRSDKKRRLVNESRQKHLEELRAMGIVVEGTQKKKKKPKKRREVKEYTNDYDLF